MTTYALDGFAASFSWTIDAESAGVTALCIGDAFAAWSACNPSIFTVRTFRTLGGVEADNTKGDIRRGSAIGSGLALIVGFGGSLVTRSWYPLVGTIAMLMVLWATYEWALANPHDKRRSIADQ